MNETQDSKRLRVILSFWEWWKRVGKGIGNLQAWVLLALFYFVILPPFALAVRWGSDPLALKAGAPQGWRPMDVEEGAPLERAIEQF